MDTSFSKLSLFSKHTLFSTSAHKRSRSSLALAFALLFALLGTACGSGFDSSTASESSDQAAPAAEVFDFSGEEAMDMDEAAMEDSEAIGEVANYSATEGSAPTRAQTTGSTGGDAAAQIPDIGRDIIYTATVELASTDVATATQEAIRTIESYGGFVFSQNTVGGAAGSSVLTFKILPAQFRAALGDLGSIGTIRSQSISADDVTAIVVDLQSRINTAEASVLRLRNLLEDAVELETIATLENQLLQRETTLEQLRGQLRVVQNQVDLATITVRVVELTNRPSVALEATTYGGHDSGFGCFDNGSTRSGEVGDPMTLCYRVTNTGDTPLVDLTFDDQMLGPELGSLIVVDGDATEIGPGGQVVFAYEFELAEPVRIRTSVEATALNADGDPLEDEVKATIGTIRLTVTDFDEGFPGFGEVLGNSWNTLKTAAIVIALAAVAIAPFLAVALILGYPVWRLRRRFGLKPKSAPAVSTPPPPPSEAPESPALSEDEGDDKNAATSATTSS